MKTYGYGEVKLQIHAIITSELDARPFSLVRIIEELLEWKSSGSGLENRKDPLR
jgi:hypothetical protein